MVVEIDYSVVNNNSSCAQGDFETLSRILTYKDRHKVIISDKRILESNFVNDSSSNLKELFTTLYINSINETSNYDAVIKSDSSELIEKEYDVHEAIIFFAKPLEIILENCENDSCLVSAIFRHFDSDNFFEKFLHENWIRFIGNGGCSSISNIINSELKSNNYKSKMLRYYVILDSDKHYSSEPVTKYEKLKQLLDENNVSYHIWEKRSAENYLPSEAFEMFRSTDTEKWIDAYLYLTDEQKDYFNIAEGYSKDFGNKTNESIPDRDVMKNTKPKEYSVIESISDSNFQLLWNGLSIKNFKNDFLNAFESRYVYKETLNNRVKNQFNPNEFYGIIKEIKGLL